MLLTFKSAILPRVFQIKYVLYITANFDRSHRQVTKLLMPLSSRVTFFFLIKINFTPGYISLF